MGANLEQLGENLLCFGMVIHGKHALRQLDIHLGLVVLVTLASGLAASTQMAEQLNRILQVAVLALRARL